MQRILEFLHKHRKLRTYIRVLHYEQDEYNEQLSLLTGFHVFLFLFIHKTGKRFHIALYPLSYLDHPCNQDNRYFPITSRANMLKDSNRSGAGK
jgi:hypothetical protein